MINPTISKLLNLFGLIVWLLFATAGQAATVYYAATNGTAGGTGSQASPWDLQTGLAKTALLVGGDSLNLRAGRYSHVPQNVVAGSDPGQIFLATISGAYTNPIYIQAHTNEFVELDGGEFDLFVTNGPIVYNFGGSRPTLQCGLPSDPTKGRFLHVRNIVIMSSSTEPRTSAGDESFAYEIGRSDGLANFGRSNIFSSLISHDVTTGFSDWSTSYGGNIYGCLAYNCGWQGTPNSHGHGIYTQNKQANGLKLISTNILINNYANCMQAYGSSGAEVYHYRILGNFLVNDTLKVGGRSGTVQGDDHIRDNFMYNADLAFLFQFSTASADMECCNNYIGKGLMQGGAWASCLLTNNTIIDSLGTTIFILLTQPYGNVLPWTVDNNHYVVPNASSPLFAVDGVGFKTFTAWKTYTGYDASSTFTAPLPSTNLIVLKGNYMDTNRANLMIYNWALSSSVAVNMASLGWSATDSVRVRNTQDYFTDITTNSLPGNVLTVNMLAASHTVAIPYGSSTVTGPKTFPQAGVFMLERLTSTAPTPTNTISIASSNPSSGVTISATSDVNGNSSGSTAFARQYLLGTPITLIAPATSTTNNFSKWQRNGVDLSFSTTINYTVDTNVTLTAVYINPPVNTWTYNVDSSDPASGASVTVTPLDNSGNGNGTTPFTRTYNDGTVVVLEAALTAGGNNFQHWLKNGVVFSTKTEITITANSAEAGVTPLPLVAAYAAPASNFRKLIVTSLNPDLGVPIVVSLADTNGLQNGTTTFGRDYGIASSVTLTAPSTAGANIFVAWADENGNQFTAGQLTSSFFMNVNRTRQAIYTNAPLPAVTVGHASARRRGTR